MNRIKKSQRKVKPVNKIKSFANDISYTSNRLSNKIKQADEEKEPEVYATEAVNNMAKDTALSAKHHAKKALKNYAETRLVEKEYRIRNNISVKPNHNLKNNPRFNLKNSKGQVFNTAKNAIANTKILTATLLLTGSIALTLSLTITIMIGLVAKSPYGVLLSTEDTGTGYTLTSVIEDINNEYLQKIDDIKNSIPHDSCEVNTVEIPWKEIVAVYAVIVSSSDLYEDTITIDAEKVDLLRSIFWDFVDVSYTISSYNDIDVLEITEESGRISEQVIIVAKTKVYIKPTVKSLSEIHDSYKYEGNKILIGELMIASNSV